MAATRTSRNAPGTRPVVVVGGNRIPFARANGPYARASNREMLTAATDGLLARFDLVGARLDEFVAGAVLKHSRDYNLARETVLGSRLDPRTPAYDLQQACGTGLEAVLAVANKIALGQVETGVAGGVDSASDAPIELNDDLRRVLLRFNGARSLPGRLRTLLGLRPGQVVPSTPRNVEPRTGLSMGEHAAITAEAWGIDRAAQDEYAAASHHKLAAAWDRGFFDDLATPYLGVWRDQYMRPDTSTEKLAKLRPAFEAPGATTEATMTAGNSSGLTDGAAVVLLASEDWARERGLPVLARITHARTAAVDYVHGDEGLLMAPAYAVPGLLDAAGLGLGDLDFYEIHEAFASQVLATLAAWRDPTFCAERLGRSEALGDVDPERLNVTGSSLAVGHPFAATGGRIVATLAKLLSEHAEGAEDAGGSDEKPARGAARTRTRRGLISICAAGGQGVTAILER